MPFENTLTEKTKLIDSGEKQDLMNIQMVTRDSERSLPSTLKMFEALENSVDCKFRYIFVENGSKDRTRQLVEQFLKTRNGTLQTPENAENIDDLVRPQRIAAARNTGTKFLDPKAKWTLLVDNDIYFDVHALTALFAESPTENGYAMVCAFAELAKFNKQTQKLQPLGHYYDTWTFTLSKNGEDYQIFWPHCVFEDCPVCQNHVRGRKLKKEGVIEVGSAYGGFALVRTAGILNKGVAYFSARVGNSCVMEHRITCELVPFCLSLASNTGQKVVVATKSHVLYDGTNYGTA